MLRTLWFTKPGGEPFELIFGPEGIASNGVADQLGYKYGTLALDGKRVTANSSGYIIPQMIDAAIANNGSPVGGRGGTRDEAIVVTSVPTAASTPAVAVRQTKVVASASMLLNQWERLGCLSYASANSWKDPKYSNSLGRQFEAWLARNRQQLHQRGGAANLVTEVCHVEPDRHGSYATAATLLQKIGSIVLEQCQLQIGSAGLQVHTLVLPSCPVTGTRVVPHVVLAITKGSVQAVTAERALSYMDSLHEIKTYTVFQTNDNEVKKGIAQVLSNVQHGLEQRGGSSLMMGGCVSDGTSIHSIIVEAHSGQELNTAVITPRLKLTQVAENTTPNTEDPLQVLIGNGSAFEELVFHVWLRLQQHLPPDMQASPSVQQLGFQRDDDFTVQVTAGSLPHKSDDVTPMSNQQTGMRVQVSGFCHGLLAGQIVGGATSSSVLVRMGFSSEQQSLAVFLEHPWTAAYQVERELAARSQLKKPVRNLAPVLASGTITVVNMQQQDGGDVLGRSVLVFPHVAEPLCQDGVLQQLPHDQLMRMAPALVAAVVDLNRQGVMHNDITPSNILKFRSSSAGYVLGLCDLGAASCSAAEALAVSVLPEAYRPLMSPTLYSPVMNLMYSSAEALLLQTLGPSSDMQSLVFSLMTLDGIQLPWELAAAAGECKQVLAIRESVGNAVDPVAALGVGGWPVQLQQLACAAVKCEKSTSALALTIAEAAPVFTYDGLKTADHLTEQYIFTPQKVKDVYLYHLLTTTLASLQPQQEASAVQQQGSGRRVRSAIIFLSTCRGCQTLSLILRELGYQRQLCIQAKIRSSI